MNLYVKGKQYYDKTKAKQDTETRCGHSFQVVLHSSVWGIVYIMRTSIYCRFESNMILTRYIFIVLITIELLVKII